jgi:hypothetical protein
VASSCSGFISNLARTTIIGLPFKKGILSPRLVTAHP